MKTTTKQKKRTLLMMALTVPFLLLSSTEYLPSAEAAGLYTPGEITDTTVAPGAADTVLEEQELITLIIVLIIPLRLHFQIQLTAANQKYFQLET